MSLSEYQEKFRRLIVNRRDGRASPHKLCMLLAVLDLARAGALRKNNKVLFAPNLLERYERFFAAVSAPGDHPNPYFPFFHLTGNLRGGDASFWHLRAVPGREAILAAIASARSISDITANIAYAELDEALFMLLQQPQSLEALAETISTHWLNRGLEDLRAVVAASGEVSHYEKRLRELEIGFTATESVPPAYVRDPAFRRVVTEQYDYRCAATGIRILLPNGEAMVEAAHIHPFVEAGDDDPRNGLALCPNMHWAMDKNLIAPGPDLKWHVSPVLDERVPDFAMLVGLGGKQVFPPTESRFAPKREVLEWRLGRLRRHPD